MSRHVSEVDTVAEQEVRSRIRAHVLEHLDQVTERVVAAIQTEIPAYATLSRDQVAEVTDIASWGTLRILDLGVEDVGLTADDLRRFRGIGAARALDGRPLPAVLRAYRLAGAELTATVEHVDPDLLTVADTMALARLWMASMDALSEAIYEGYQAAADRVIVDRDRAVGDLADDLLVGRQVTRTNLADRARELASDLDRTDAPAPAQPHDLPLDLLGRAVGAGLRPTRTIDHPRIPFGSEPGGPFAGRRDRDHEHLRRHSRRPLVFDDELGEPQPGAWGQSSVSVGHEGLLQV